jgi:hypothetical protein
MANTTNFGWETPDDTDLVKDGAAAMRTLGNSIDTSFVDLKGGTTGQVLAKNSNTDLDFVWASDATGIPATIFDAKGDLIAASAADTAARLAVGTNGQYLSADSTTATGLKWVTASAGALTKIAATSFTDVATQDFDSVFSATYDAYLITINNAFSPTSSTADLHLQMRYSTSTETADYFGAIQTIVSTPTTSTTGANPAAHCLLSNGLGLTGYPTTAVFNVVFPKGGGNSGRANIFGESFSAVAPEIGNFGYEANTSRVYTGFRLKASTGNITGSVVIYGLEK